MKLALALVALLSIATLATAKDFPVDWMVHEYAPINVAVGDTVTFTWEGRHGVSGVPTGDCPDFGGNDPAVIVLAEEARKGTYVWTATAPGSVWVACPTSDHCAEGQIVEVIVA